jgi:hypothetical protein
LKSLLISVFIFFSLCDVSLGIDMSVVNIAALHVCDSSTGGTNSLCANVVPGSYLYDTRTIVNTAGASCQSAVQTYVDSGLDGVISNGCQVWLCYEDCSSGSSVPPVLRFGICCPDSGATAEASSTGQSRTEYSSIARESFTVTSVQQGHEVQATDAQCDSWYGTVGAAPAESGFVNSGLFHGESYVSTVNSDGTETLGVDCWKISQNSPSGGSVVPYGGAGTTGGGGSGGLTQDQTATAVQTGTGTALTNSGLTGDILGQKMKDAFDYAKQQGDFSSGGGGLTADQASGIANPVAGTGDFVAPTAPDASSFQLDAGSASALSSSFTSTVSSSFSTFSGAAKSTGVGSLISSFFGNVPAMGGTVPIVIDGGTTFGSHSLDLASIFTPVPMGILHSVILVLFGYLSIRVIILKR